MLEEVRKLLCLRSLDWPVSILMCRWYGFVLSNSLGSEASVREFSIFDSRTVSRYMHMTWFCSLKLLWEWSICWRIFIVFVRKNVTKIQNYQVTTLKYSSELLMWMTDHHCIEQGFNFNICLTVVNRINEITGLEVQNSRVLYVWKSTGHLLVF